MLWRKAPIPTISHRCAQIDRVHLWPHQETSPRVLEAAACGESFPAGLQVCRAGVVVLTSTLWRTPSAWRCILAFMNAKKHLCLLQDSLPCRGGVESLGARGTTTSHTSPLPWVEAQLPPEGRLNAAPFCLNSAEAFIEAAPEEIRNHRDAYGVPHGLFATASSVMRFDRHGHSAVKHALCSVECAAL